MNTLIEPLVYGLGIIVSILASKGVGGDWIPENKFSFQPSAIFPSPVLTVGTIAALSQFVNFPATFFGYSVPVALGLLIGVVVTKYLAVMSPQE